MTILFSDDFESGDSTAWDGTQGTPTIQTAIVHHGVYASQYQAQNTGDAQYQYQATGNTAQYLRYRYYFKDTLPSNAAWRLGGLSASLGTHYRMAWVDYNFSTSKFGVAYNNSANVYSWETGTTPLQINNWYNIQLYFDPVGKTATLWVNDTQKVTVTDEAWARTLAYIIMGIPYVDTTNEAAVRTVIVDCVVSSDAYITSEMQLFTLINQMNY